MNLVRLNFFARRQRSHALLHLQDIAHNKDYRLIGKKTQRATAKQSGLSGGLRVLVHARCVAEPDCGSPRPFSLMLRYPCKYPSDLLCCTLAEAHWLLARIRIPEMSWMWEKHGKKTSVHSHKVQGSRITRKGQKHGRTHRTWPI
jgi:hypothetical protein